MQNIIDALAQLFANAEIAQDAFHEPAVVAIALDANTLAYGFQVEARSRRKIIDGHHALVLQQQLFEQVRTNKTSGAGDQPGFILSCDSGLGLVEAHVGIRRLSIALAPVIPPGSHNSAG